MTFGIQGYFKSDIHAKSWIIEDVPDGTFIVRGNLPTNNRYGYYFKTKEWATQFLDFCLRTDQIKADTRVALLTHAYGIISFGSNQRVWCLGDITIVEWDHYGNLIKFDLPRLVWIWFKNSLIGKLFKRLWVGDNKWNKQHE